MILFLFKLNSTEKENEFNNIQQILQTPLSFVDKTAFYENGLLSNTFNKDTTNNRINTIRNQVLLPIVEDDFDKFKQFIIDDVNFNNQIAINPSEFDFNLTFINNNKKKNFS